MDKRRNLYEDYHSQIDIYSCASSSFMLNGTSKERFGCFKDRKKNNPLADDIKKKLHVTDLISASDDKVETRKLKRIASRSFSGGTFTQSKCYSNLKEFQGDTKQVKKTLKKNTCFSFAKVHGRATNNNTKIFRVA